MFKINTVFIFVAFAVMLVPFSSMPVFAKDPIPPTGEQCTDKDLKKITSFNRKVKRKRNENEKLRKKSKSIRTMSQIKSYNKKKLEVEEFFESEEYKKMEPIYSRCKISMPNL